MAEPTIAATRGGMLRIPRTAHVPIAALTVASAATAWWLVGVTAAAGVAAAGVFLAIAATDAIELRIPDRLSLPLIVGGIALTATGVWPGTIVAAAAGAVALYGLGALLAAIGRATGDRATFGRGDWKLQAATGAWLGLTAGTGAVALAMAVSAILLLLAARADRTTAVALPFGAILGPLSAAGVLWVAFGSVAG